MRSGGAGGKLNVKSKTTSRTNNFSCLSEKVIRGLSDIRYRIYDRR